MEIKQGDKVRVSKDAPKLYLEWGEDVNWREEISTVTAIDKDAADIMCIDEAGDNAYVTIPTKYLVKVDAEAKEAKFKVNDVVRTVFNETTHITSVLGNGNYYLYGMGNEYPEDSLTLIQSYTEPTEQTHQRYTVISEGDILSLDEPPTYKIGSIKIPVEVDLSDSYWNAYTADLAKEIALKVANKFNTPLEAAEYAVSVAKAVAEGLKRK